MKGIRNTLLTIAPLLLAFQILLSPSAGAVTVQAGIFNTGTTLTVKAKAGSGDLTTAVSIPFAVIVTVRYLTSYGITLSSPTGSFGFILDNTVTSGSYTYKIFASVTTTTQSFLNGVQVDLFSTVVSGGTGVGTIEITNDAVAVANGGEWYFEYAGLDYTATPPFYNAQLTGVPLPVELTVLTGRREKNRVTLEWKTASELNNSGFDVERSADLTGWRKQAFVPGHGTTDQPRYYTYCDDLQADAAVVPALYYRLRQVDRDGRFRYSDVVTVLKPAEASRSAPVSVRLLPAYPNPFSGGDGVVIPLTVHERQPVTLYVTSASGEVVQWIYSGDVLAPGSYHREFNASGLPSGVYFIVLQYGEQTARQKVVYAK